LIIDYCSDFTRWSRFLLISEFTQLSLNQGWFRASAAVIRCLGSI